MTLADAWNAFEAKTAVISGAGTDALLDMLDKLAHVGQCRCLNRPSQSKMSWTYRCFR